MKPRKDLVLMSCCSVQHQAIISMYKGVVTLHVHLITYRNVFKRIVAAFKYIFNAGATFGEWDSMLLDETHVPQLEEAVKYLKGKTE